MRRLVTTAAVAAMVALATLVPAGPASADSVTVQGTSSLGTPTNITKMVVNNRDTSVVVKVFGTGGKNNVDEVVVRLKDGDGTAYRAIAGWYPGGAWAKSLERGSTLVSCDGLVFSWVGDGGYWKVVVPRSCLRRLADRIKAKSEMASYETATPGYTPWSPWVRRG